MPRLRSKVLSNSDTNDSIENFAPNVIKNGKRKTRKQSNKSSFEDVFSVSKLGNEQMLSEESSMELVSVIISPDLHSKTTETSSNEEEIETKKVSKRKSISNKSKISSTEVSEKENEQYGYQTRNSRRSLRNNVEDNQSDDETSKRQLRSRRKSTLDISKINNDLSKKRRSLASKKSDRKKSNHSISDIETNEIDKTIYKTKENKRKGRKSFIDDRNLKSNKVENENVESDEEKNEKSSEVNNSYQIDSKLGNEFQSRSRRSKSRPKSTQTHENSFNDNENPLSENNENEEIPNRSKLNRRSTRIHENSFEAVKDLILKSENHQVDVELNRRTSINHETSLEGQDLITDDEDRKSEEQEIDANLRKSKIDRRSTSIHENSFEVVRNLTIDNEDKKDTVEMNQNKRVDRRSTRIQENSFEVVKNLTIDNDQEVNMEMNRSKKTDRRSTRIHENSFQVVKDLITDDEDLKSDQEVNVELNGSKSKMLRRSPREKSIEVVQNNNEMNITFSPKSPNLQYQEAFTPTINGRNLRRSKYETSTPAKLDNKILLLKSTTKKPNLNQTPKNISLIDLTNFTPRSIIKKSLVSTQNSKSMKKNNLKSQITIRKKRSLSEMDLTSLKKSRVTFHPNTSVFHMDSLDSTVEDDSELSLNIHSTSLIKVPSSKKSIDFVSINPLNDTYDMEMLGDQSADPIEGAHLSIKSNTPEIEGIRKLNETFTPDEDKPEARVISKKIKIHEVQPLVTDSSEKKKVYKKTPKRLVNSSIRSSFKKNLGEQKTPLKVSESNLQGKNKTEVNNKNHSTTKLTNHSTNKNNVLNSLRKSPNKNQPTPKRVTSAKKMPDFASIHKRNFEKMESLHENVAKRAERAKQLFALVPESGNKTNSTQKPNKPTRLPVPVKKVVTTSLTTKTPNKENTPGKSNLSKAVNRFDFNLRNAKENKEILKEELKKKQAIRGDLGTLRQKERQYIKGVRSNRRFDLLMQSRDCK